MMRIGTAGWAVPRRVADAFPRDGTGLQRYAARFDAAEINTSFYRPHKPATYARWAESVPEGFRFAVKVPKAITHEHKLTGTEALLDDFLASIAPLGRKLGPLLVQLPPSLAFEATVADSLLGEPEAEVCGSSRVRAATSWMVRARGGRRPGQPPGGPGRGRSRARSGGRGTRRVDRAGLYPPARIAAHVLFRICA